MLHYMANPNAMHRNSSVALDQMTSGSGHNWLLGEVSGHYQPWGYPFNWRKLSLPFNAGPESYGQPSGNGVQLALADGSVIMLANKADSQIVDSLATSPPVAEPGKTSIPDVEFRYTKSHAAESVSLGSGELPDWPDAALTATIWIDSHGHPFAVFVACWSKGNCPDMTVQHLHMLAEQYPETQTLIMPRMSLGDEHVIELPLFSKLKVLSIAEIRLTEQGFSALQQLKTLRHLIVRAEDSELRKLRTALPDCEFTLR